MEFIYLLLHIIEYVFIFYFGFAAVYVLIFALAGKLKSSKRYSPNTVLNRDVAVLIPGYKEDNVIYDVALDALNQDYPKEHYDVIVIADSFKQETLEKLRTLPIILIEVSFEKSTKSKALNVAMEQLKRKYDIALVLDADNLMATDFITKINAAFAAGFEVVQGHRVAKNTNTSFAVLDAISEELNNHIFRKGHRALGLSSALIGSGMAFDYKMFKSRMLKIEAVGGFDKELELTLLRDKKKIEYLNEAIVFDEKTQKVEVFENQRKRWLSAQFVYFGRFFFSGIYQLIFKGNIDFFDKVYQMISPPRILLIGITGIIALFYFLFHLIFSTNNIMIIPFNYWLLVFEIVVFAFLLSIPSKFHNKQTLKALFTIPKAFFSMFFSLFKLKGANKKFIHTEHGSPAK
ncbi:MAG: glycosyltransferase family 2 protein [Paludibacter sp.]|nr:glycosyltransferase family 2 protein [Paludibacter sp.]